MRKNKYFKPTFILERWAADVGYENMSQCFFCKYLWDFEVNKNNKSCDAFPDGIPEEIFTNQFDHRKAYEGDNRIGFLAREQKYQDIQFNELDR